MVILSKDLDEVSLEDLQRVPTMIALFRYGETWRASRFPKIMGVYSDGEKNAARKLADTAILMMEIRDIFSV
jgi:hypothetical protein